MSRRAYQIALYLWAGKRKKKVQVCRNSSDSLVSECHIKKFISNLQPCKRHFDELVSKYFEF